MDKKVRANLLTFLNRTPLTGYKEAIAMVEIINSLNEKGDTNEQRANPTKVDDD